MEQIYVMQDVQDGKMKMTFQPKISKKMQKYRITYIDFYVHESKTIFSNWFQIESFLRKGFETLIRKFPYFMDHEVRNGPYFEVTYSTVKIQKSTK